MEEYETVDTEGSKDVSVSPLDGTQLALRPALVAVRLRVRSGPSKAAEGVEILEKDTRIMVEVLEDSPGWYKLGDGRYVRADLVMLLD